MHHPYRKSARAHGRIADRDGGKKFIQQRGVFGDAGRQALVWMRLGFSSLEIGEALRESKKTDRSSRGISDARAAR